MEKEEVQTKVEEVKAKTKKKNIYRSFIYMAFVLIATGIALFLSLRTNYDGVVKAFSGCDWRWILIIVAVMVFFFAIDALVFVVFMRLYTRRYHLHQGLAVSMIGSFYAGITPGASGGQVSQALVLKKQGAQISSAASILVMYFILHQVVLIFFDIITVIFKWSLLSSIGSLTVGSFSISLIPLTIAGFALNVLIIGLLFLMSYSHKIHNFIMHYGVGLLSKLHILKKPDQARETIRIQVENFKIELRRLQSNLPVTIIIIVLMFLSLMCKFSIPWFAGMALNGYGYHVNVVGEIIHTTGYADFASVWDACFMSSYHQMISGLIPVPGGAGVSELFFNKLFENFYTSAANVNAAQIIWRSATFYMVLIMCGLFSAFYKTKPSEHVASMDRRTFVTMQLETYEERKSSSDTIYETAQISRKELQNRLRDSLVIRTHKERNDPQIIKIDEKELVDSSPFVYSEGLNFHPDSNKKTKRKKRKEETNEWRDLNLD